MSYDGALSDPSRLSDLASMGIVDTAAEESFDRLTRLAARLIRTPVALASFVDDSRQFFKSRYGEIAEPWMSARETPLSHSFCQHVVMTGRPLVVENSREHPLVQGNLAIEDLGVVAYAGMPIHSPSGSVLGSLCVIDTEERHWTEDELEILRDLAGGVDSEIALRVARDQAESANRAKSTFLANMSHELRTPLSAVLGLTTLLQRTSLDSEQQEYLEIIESSGRDLMGLLDEILDLARIEADKLRVERAPFDIGSVLGGPLRALGVRAREDGLAFEIEVAPDVPRRVVGDGARIRQMLVNLVGNALKFTRKGGVSIEVSRAEDEKDLIRFVVSDTGIGIDPAAQGSIFEPFVQADSSCSRNYSGTGLGLSITARVVGLMGGEIDVESEPGRGSRFTVELPLPKAPEPPEESAEPMAAEAGPRDESGAVRPKTESLETGSPQTGSPQTVARDLEVLLVDDNPANLLVGEKLLEQDGHRVRTATDGHRALELVCEMRFDVILMDLQMPELDGLETSRRIRRFPGPAQRTPIVALTAHAMDGDREICLEAGMDDFLSKPLDLGDLRRTLARTVSGAGLRPLSRGEPGQAETAGAPSRHQILETLGGSESLLAKVSEAWRRQGDELLPALRRSVESRDLGELSRLAHKIRGTALVLGAETLAEATDHLANLAGSMGSAEADLEAAHDRFLAAYEAVSRQLRPRPGP